MPYSQSPVARERLPFLIGAVTITVAVSLLKISWLTAVVGVLAALVFWFFRDPERSGPADEGVVLSPADGRIVGIEEISEDRFLKERAIRISIFLNIFNVHVNRIPCSGKIKEIAYQPGQFLMAHRSDASLKNEQNAMLLERSSGGKILFVQIAGWIARRIVCWKRPGDLVQQGERFGMIRFGSRTDIYLPLEAQIRVKVGDHVKGGLSVIGEIL